jgi:hypothetical protein
MPRIVTREVGVALHTALMMVTSASRFSPGKNRAGASPVSTASSFWMSAMRLSSRDRPPGLTPLIWEHANPYGRFEIDMATRLPLN